MAGRIFIVSATPLTDSVLSYLTCPRKCIRECPSAMDRFAAPPRKAQFANRKCYSF